MKFEQNGFQEIEKKARRMFEASLLGLTNLPGCTCSPKPRIYLATHDEMEIVVSTTCTAHAAVMGIMDYDQYIRLRKEYFSERKRMDTDGKLLRAKTYTQAEHRLIEERRKHVQELAEKLRVLGDTWRSFFDSSDSNAVAIDIVQFAQKTRYERNETRRLLNEATREYRMAVEGPALRQWKIERMAAEKRQANKGQFTGVVAHRYLIDEPGPNRNGDVLPNEKFDFLPFAPGMKVNIDPDFRFSGSPFSAPMRDSWERLKERVKELSTKKDLTPKFPPFDDVINRIEDQEMNRRFMEMLAKKFPVTRVFRDFRDTGLRHNLRKK